MVVLYGVGYASPLSRFPAHNDALGIAEGEGVKLLQEPPVPRFEVAFHEYPITLIRLLRTPAYGLLGVP